MSKSQSATTANLNDSLLAFCKASADPFRLSVLRVLNRDSFSVSELCQVLDYKQSGLSHHLKILAQGGLVERRREGNTLFYRRSYRTEEPGLQPLLEALWSSVDQTALAEEVDLRLAQLQTERAEHSRDFFSQNADSFKAQQEQIAAFEVYGPAAAELLAANVSAGEQALELGPGDGRFLTELASRFKQVYGLDSSQAMLNQAAEQIRQEQLANVELIHGDSQLALEQGIQVDAIAVNMVLHHIPSPAEVIADLGQLLKAGGQLFITELCRHDQSWVQGACGDLWLGFEPEDLSDWAAKAGLHEGKDMYLSQRNGFRVQLRQFVKP